jgi:hypothetical protein
LRGERYRSWFDWQRKERSKVRRQELQDRVRLLEELTQLQDKIIKHLETRLANVRAQRTLKRLQEPKRKGKK